MKWVATSPDKSETVVIEQTEQGTKICRSGSPEVCRLDENQPLLTQAYIEELWHKGWEIRVD